MLLTTERKGKSDKMKPIYDALSLTKDYRQQEMLEEEVSPIIRGTPDDGRSF